MAALVEAQHSVEVVTTVVDEVVDTRKILPALTNINTGKLQIIDYQFY